MVLRVFGLKKKKGAEVVEAPAPSPVAPVEFQETTPVPAAASPPESETVPAAVGAAKALRAARSGADVADAPIQPGKARKPAKRPAARKAKKTAGAKLSRKQLAQRKYASRMRTVRKRAKTASGGKGRIAKRSGATKLRRQLGLNSGKTSRKGPKKKR